MIAHGYKEGKQPFIFFREVEKEGERSIRVEVDFLAGEYEGTPKGRRTQSIQDIRARKARGCDLAFLSNKEVRMEGELPDGGRDSVKARVAGIVPFIIMKGMAMEDRSKEKGPWDIYFCLRHNPEGIDGIIEEFEPFIKNGLVKEGLMCISRKFASPEHIGPKQVSDFEEISGQEERARIQRDAFERVDYLLRSLKIENRQ